jgi:lipopolysaccharide biosynthesis glycosyltransferase
MYVVCAVEREPYVRHCAVMLRSLLQHARDGSLQIEYLHGDDTSSYGRRLIARMVEMEGAEIRFRRVPDALVKGFPVKGFTRKATWYRVLLDELLPESRRVLYLDVDLMVCGSLAELWSTDLQDNLVGAVTNVPELHERAYVERPELGGDPYFNAGVLLLDLDGIRREGAGERLRRLAREEGGRLRWRDQDALNEVLHDRRGELHPRWNCMNAVMNFPWAADYFGAAELAEARRAPAIRHFEGPDANKPWHLLAEPAMRAQYRELRGQTPWPRTCPSGCTLGNLWRHARRRLLPHRFSPALRIEGEQKERSC